MDKVMLGLLIVLTLFSLLIEEVRNIIIALLILALFVLFSYRDWETDSFVTGKQIGRAHV